MYLWLTNICKLKILRNFKLSPFSTLSSDSPSGWIQSTSLLLMVNVSVCCNWSSSADAHLIKNKSLNRGWVGSQAEFSLFFFFFKKSAFILKFFFILCIFPAFCVLWSEKKKNSDLIWSKYVQFFFKNSWFGGYFYIYLCLSYQCIAW